MLLSEPLKQRLIRIAHSGARPALRTRLELPLTVLGRKICKSKTMNPSFSWLNKINGEVRRDELMSAHTSIRIGGPADIFILPQDVSDLQTIFRNLGNTPVFILGEGSNLLVRDRGIRGIVVCLKESFESVQSPLFFRREKDRDAAIIRAGAGIKVSYLAKYAARFSLTGIEHLVGIPGSLGGALIMNAGAEGTEIGQVVRSVTRVTAEGKIEKLKGEELQFQYRKTNFPVGGGILIEAELELEKGDALKIHEKMDRHLSRRGAKQPLSLPNSGSVFKNPPGDSAGRLIETCGLKGTSQGEAGVSLKHANFIVNKNQATAKDVIQLIEHVQNVVKEKTGTELETEIVIVGE